MQPCLPSPLCHVVLVEPEIPDNTGNIGRTCVGTESCLHLVGKLGFEINEKRVKRAGLDYWSRLHWQHHPTWNEWQGLITNPARVFYFSTKAKNSIYDVSFQRGDWLVFGKETKGLDEEIVRRNEAQAVCLPMPGQIRSLNLSNAVAVAVFELLRQTSIKVT